MRKLSLNSKEGREFMVLVSGAVLGEILVLPPLFPGIKEPVLAVCLEVSKTKAKFGISAFGILLSEVGYSIEGDILTITGEV